MANGNYEVQLRLNVILVNVFKEKLQQIELFSFYSFKIRYLKYSPPSPSVQFLYNYWH